MKPAEIAARLTGISTPIGGLSWTPPTVDRDVARRVLTVLEDRRVLFNDLNWEVPDDCVASVVEIRHFLTDVLGAGGIDPNLEQPLRLARGYCRTFLDTVGFTEDDLHDGAGDRRLNSRPGYGWHDWHFAQALGQLRAPVSACKPRSSRPATTFLSKIASRPYYPRSNTYNHAPDSRQPAERGLPSFRRAR